MHQAPVFEESTSTLWYSNDGALRVSGGFGEWVVQYNNPADPCDSWTDDGIEEVFRTLDRVKADAYIAGYDLAIENQIADAFNAGYEAGKQDRP